MRLDPKSINQCVRCGSCRTFCPVLEESGWESANARGRIMILKGLTRGLSPDSKVLESLNTCTTCGICTENCPAGINPPQMIETARRELVSMGVMTRQQEDLSRIIYSSGNTFGEAEDRHSWLPDRSSIPRSADYVYFVGCMNSYRYPETAARTRPAAKKTRERTFFSALSGAAFWCLGDFAVFLEVNTGGILAVTLWKNFICNTCLWGMVVFLPGGMLGPGIVRLR